MELIALIALVWIPVLLVVGLLAYRRRMGLRLAQRAIHAAFQTGDWEQALSDGRWLARSGDPALERRAAEVMTMALNGLARHEEELELLETRMSENGSAPVLNHLINAYISSGRYRAALALDTSGVQHLRDVDGPWRSFPALIDINLAEAEYNLGLWKEAEARLEGSRFDGFPLTRAGHRLQLGWVLAHTGRGAAALAICDEVQPSELPGVFHAELHYSRGAALLALHRLDDARAEVERGRACAKRRSSVRNGLNLRARVELAAGDWATAERLCREAAELGPIGQGGDGLVLWAQALTKLGRVEEARAAWQLALERDPESASAAQAREELAKAA